MELGSVSGGSITQNIQANTQQEVRRNDQQQHQAELKSSAPQENAPQAGQRVGSLIDISV